MRARRLGLSKPVLALLLAVVVAVAGVGLFIVTANRVASSSSSASPTTNSGGGAVTTSARAAANSTITATQTESSGTNVNTTSTVSCPTTTFTAAPQPTASQELAQIVGTFSSASISFGVNGPTGQVIDASYNVLQHSPYGSNMTLYKVQFSETVNASTSDTTAWILSNGTTLAAEQAGQNVTGPYAGAVLFLSVGSFTLMYNIGGAAAYVPPADVTLTGDSNVTIGPTDMTVMDYQAKSLPIIYAQNSCSDIYDLSAFEFQAGYAPGTNLYLLTYVSEQGVQQASGSQTSVNLFFRLISITVA